MKSQEVTFQKITVNACFPATKLSTDKSQYGGYIPAILNKRPFVEVLSEQFLWFLKNEPFVVSSHFALFWPKTPFDFSDVLHKENYSLPVSKYD